MSLTSGHRYSRAAIAGFGLFWIVVAGVGYAFVHARSQEFAVGMYVIAGLGLLSVLVQAAQFAKHGEVLATFPIPGAPGGKLTGTVRFPKPLDARHAKATLRCKHVYWRRQRGDEEDYRSEDLVWSSAMLAPIRRVGAQSECRIEFRLPPDAQPSTSLTTGSGTQGTGFYWELEVTADVPGLDLERSFIVQVVKIPA